MDITGNERKDDPDEKVEAVHLKTCTCLIYISMNPNVPELAKTFFLQT